MPDDEVPFRGPRNGGGRAVVSASSNSSSSRCGDHAHRHHPQPALPAEGWQCSCTSCTTPTYYDALSCSLTSRSSPTADLSSDSTCRCACEQQGQTTAYQVCAMPAIRHDTLTVTHPHPTAQQQGTTGRKIDLKTNYIALDKDPAWSLYQYRAFVIPQVDSPKLRTWLVKSAFVAADCPIIYVGEEMYSSKKLEESSMHRVLSPQDDHQVFRVVIENVGPVTSGNHVCIQVYNQLVRKFMLSMGLNELGSHFYDVKKAEEIPNRKLTQIQGFVTSIRNHEDQVLLCVDTTTKVIQQDTVLDLINERKNRGKDWKRIIGNLVVNSTVLTTYNDKIYTIASIEWDLTPKSAFSRGHDKTTTYAELYKSSYGLMITDNTQPLLRARLCKTDLPRRSVMVEKSSVLDVMLAPEFCQRTRDSAQTVDQVSGMNLHVYSNEGPIKKVEMLNQFIDELFSSEEVKTELKEWSLAFRKELITVPARVLNEETIICGNQEFERGNYWTDWSELFESMNRILSVSESKRKRMFSAAILKSWTVVVPQCDSSGVDKLVCTMDEVGRQLGLPIPRPQEIIEIPYVSVGAYLKALQRLRKKQNDLVFVIIPSNKSKLYEAIKRHLTCDQGLVSQCFTANCLKSNGLDWIVSKFVVKMNIKLGGEPWTLKWPIEDMMVVGVDVYPGTVMTGGRNVAAMVASVTGTYGRYFSTVSMYGTPDELSSVVASDLMKCVNAYSWFNFDGRFPSKILIYRDGVDEDELEEVYNIELEQVNAALKRHYEQKGQEEPKLTFVVVNRKTNTRLFTTHSKDVKNPPCGTVVDDVITLPTRQDFYLISQKGYPVTIPPAYNVMWDTQGLRSDQIQDLTFKFCHMNFSSSGTVAVPAPCQYAQKLAKLVAVDFGRAPHPKLAYNLHFL